MSKPPIEDLVGTWWTLVALNKKSPEITYKVNQVRLDSTGRHQVHIHGTWLPVLYNELGPYMIGWRQRKPLSAPTWAAPSLMVADYLEKLAAMGHYQPYQQAYLARSIDSHRDVRP